MKSHLKEVPVYAPVGRIASAAADEAVSSGRAYSLRGRAILMLDASGVEKILQDLHADPDVIRPILAAVRRLAQARDEAGDDEVSPTDDPQGGASGVR